MGSPPPMRGKVRCRPTGKGARRITPAYAGKSIVFPHLLPVESDHPRLCGEKIVNKVLKLHE